MSPYTKHRLERWLILSVGLGLGLVAWAVIAATLLAALRRAF